MTNLSENIYLVNLDTRIDRETFMKYKLDKLGLSFTRIGGILGYDYKDRYYNYMRQFTQREIKENKNINSLGAYGLLLTYIKKICPLYKSINNHVLIIEDDICFHKDFNNMLEKYNYLTKNNDVIWFGCQQVKWFEYMERFSEMCGCYKTSLDLYNNYIPYGTYCIAFSPRFLKILEHELSISFSTKNIRNIDVFITIVLKKYSFLTSCVVCPNLVVPQVLESDNMGPRDINTMVEIRKWDLSQYNYCKTTAYFSEIYKTKKVYDYMLDDNISKHDIMNLL